MGAENRESCSQRDSAEREGYVRAHRSFRRIWKERDSAQPELLEKILDKDNLNRAFKRIKANKGAPGIDGMTVEEAEHTSGGTARSYRRNQKGEIYSRPGKTSGNPKTRRWNTKAWYSNSQRPYFPASHNTTAYAGL